MGAADNGTRNSGQGPGNTVSRKSRVPESQSPRSPGSRKYGGARPGSLSRPRAGPTVRGVSFPDSRRCPRSGSVSGRTARVPQHRAPANPRFREAGSPTRLAGDHRPPVVNPMIAAPGDRTNVPGALPWCTPQPSAGLPPADDRVPAATGPRSQARLLVPL